MSNNQLTYTASAIYAMVSIAMINLFYIFVRGTSPDGFIQSVLQTWSYPDSRLVLQYTFTYFGINFTLCLMVLFSKRWQGIPFKALLTASWVLVLAVVLNFFPLRIVDPYFSTIAAILLSVRLFNSSQINPAYFSWIEPVKNLKFTKQMLTLVKKLNTKTVNILASVFLLIVFVAFIVALEKERAKEDYFSNLDVAAIKAFNNGDFANAKAYAVELETLTPKYKDHYGYGHAIQNSNIVLGRIALKEGRVEAARKHLISAGKSPGGPGMNSFGPNMSLAKELLEHGEKEVVIEYFKLCKSFWELDYGRLDKWIILVQTGKTPDFGDNLRYR